MEIAKSAIFLCIFLCLTFISTGDEDVENSRRRHRPKLFVFGDSYVDTGNWPNKSGGWVSPYGITFPGHPSGRFSDGRVLTDYIASFLGIETPLPYKLRKVANESQLKRGMNFACGGTGVFDTWEWVNLPNLTTQIHLLKQQVHEKVYSKHDLETSIAFVSTGGNDYGAFLSKNGTFQGMPAFTRKLIHQLYMDLKRIHKLGVQRVAVTAMEPTGCTPQQTIELSYKKCIDSFNQKVEHHNSLLREAVQKLNNQTTSTSFIFLDLYHAFLSAIKKHHQVTREKEYRNALRPCCTDPDPGVIIGTGEEKKYDICKKPELSFFWDMVHPSQNGWRSIYRALLSSLPQLY